MSSKKIQITWSLIVRLELCRLASGLNKTEFTKKIGSSGQVWARWIYGQAVPFRTSLARVAEAAGCRLAWLETGVGLSGLAIGQQIAVDTFARRLDLVRVLCGFSSRAELADHLQISRQALSNFSSRGALPPNARARLIDAGFSERWLVYGELPVTTDPELTPGIAQAVDSTDYQQALIEQQAARIVDLERLMQMYRQRVAELEAQISELSADKAPGHRVKIARRSGADD